VPILGGDAMSSPGLMSVAKEAAEGVIVASFFHGDEPRPEIQRFKTTFAQKYGVPPDAGSALGYDCVQLIAQGMRSAKSAAPDEVASALHDLRGWRGVTATFTFEENGDMTEKPVILSVVRGGQFEFLAAPGSVATGPVASARLP